MLLKIVSKVKVRLSHPLQQPGSYWGTGPKHCHLWKLNPHTVDQRPHGYFKGRPQPAVEQDTSYFVLFFGVSGIGKIWMWEKSIVKTYKK